MKLSNIQNVFYKKPSFLNPEKVIEELGVHQGDIVVDYGTGVGFWTLHLARKVGKKGKVYALSSNSEFLSLIKKKSQLENLGNIETRDIKLNHGKIKLDKKVDFVIISNVLHVVENPILILENAKGMLKIRGKVLVIDFLKLKTLFGPPMHHRLSEEEVISIARNVKLHFRCLIDAGWYHYGLLFENNKKYKHNLSTLK